MLVEVHEILPFDRPNPTRASRYTTPIASICDGLSAHSFKDHIGNLPSVSDCIDSTRLAVCFWSSSLNDQEPFHPPE